MGETLSLRAGYTRLRDQRGAPERRGLAAGLGIRVGRLTLDLAREFGLSDLGDPAYVTVAVR